MTFKLLLPVLQGAKARVGRGLLAEQPRNVGSGFLLGLNLRDLALHHRQLPPQASELPLQGAAVGGGGGLGIGHDLF